MMKNLKIKLAILAILMGVSAAFATAPHRAFANQKWGRDAATGLYLNITGQSKGIDYTCTGSSAVCTAVYPQGVDPNDQDHDAYPGTAAPVSTELGAFGQ